MERPCVIDLLRISIQCQVHLNRNIVPIEIVHMDIFILTLKILCVIVGYEIIRSWVKRIFIRQQNVLIRNLSEHHKTKLDRYKFMNKIIVKHEILNDNEINQAILDYSKENGISAGEVRNKVELYIDEIVPMFNLLSYFKIGYSIANILLNMIYEVVIDHGNAEKLDRIREGNVVVFIMNHKSNIDYILVAYMLAKKISVSYAVGEWARVWPLEHIFKSFGSYFVRRKFNDRLYHFVLEKYVQLISLHGVTQGIFFEGGLSRTGSLREPKLGIIDYIVNIKKNKSFTSDILFIPVGINYDWILEDKNLVSEWKSNREKTGFRENFTSFVKIAFRGPFILFLNLFRLVTGRLKHHGYASVSFGEPVSLNAFLKTEKHDIFKMERKKRLAHVRRIAGVISSQIGQVIPVTPVPLTARAILTLKGRRFDTSDLVKTVMSFRKILKKKNCRIVQGKAFESSMKVHGRLGKEKGGGRRNWSPLKRTFLKRHWPAIP